MVYDMRRTNVYLDERQLRTLRELGRSQGKPVAALVREAVDAWLASQGITVMEEDEWARRFESLLNRRQSIADAEGFSVDHVERDVSEAVREVRKARTARRR